MLTMRNIWLSMKSVLRSARQMINAELEPLNLTGAEGDILFHLQAEVDGLSQEKLAERLDVDKAAISRTVNALVRKGYVLRERQPGDARAYRVMLTQTAKEISVQIEHVYESVYGIAKQGIENAEFQSLMKLLEKVAENLDTRG